MKCRKCGEELEYLGRTKADDRRVYGCKKCNLIWAETKIPTTLLGPTTAEIKQFEEEHADAEPCPICGFKFYVSIYGIKIAYEIVEDEGFCSVCHGNPEFRSSCQKASEKE